MNKNQINSAVKGLDNILKAGNLLKLKRGRLLNQNEQDNLKEISSQTLNTLETF